MIQYLKNIFARYKNVILYLFFGGCSTLINICTYYGIYVMLRNVIIEKNAILSANIISWIITILFVYLTNRTAVFNSNATTVKSKLLELLRFTASRLATLVLESIILLIGETLDVNTLITKLIAQFAVITTNFIISKLFVFK